MANVRRRTAAETEETSGAVAAAEAIENRARSVDTDESDMPAGFTSARRKRADGFWRRDAGLIVQGELLERYTRKGRTLRGERAYYLIRVSKPCECHVDVTPEGAKSRVYEERTLPAGSVVAVDETADLKLQLKERAESDTSYDVWIKCLGKEDIGENEMWRMKVGIRAVGPKNEREPV